MQIMEILWSECSRCIAPDYHMNRVFGTTNGPLQNIKVAFQCVDKDEMEKKIARFMRPRYSNKKNIHRSLN